MSDELDNSLEGKKKTTSKKKEVGIIEKYQYVAGENEKLIVDLPSESLENIEKRQELIADLPSEPLKLIESEKHVESLIDVVSSKIKIEKKVIMKSNKELYESYMKELKYYSLVLNGYVIYDSSIDKSKNSPVIFENDFFILYGKKYSYNGLKIQKINVR